MVIIGLATIYPSLERFLPTLVPLQRNTTIKMILEPDYSNDSSPRLRISLESDGSSDTTDIRPTQSLEKIRLRLLLPEETSINQSYTRPLVLLMMPKLPLIPRLRLMDV